REKFFDLPGNTVYVRHAIHTGQQTLGVVVADQRGSLLVIFPQPFLEYSRIVVLSNWLSSRRGFLGALDDPAYERLVVDHQFDHRVEGQTAFAKHRLHRIGLSERARITVQDEAICT